MKKHALYISQSCYFCQKVMFFIADKEHSIELRPVSEIANMQALLNGGGKSQVPCLRIESADNGAVTWLYESDDIISYITSNDLLTC